MEPNIKAKICFYSLFKEPVFPSLADIVSECKQRLNGNMD